MQCPHGHDDGKCPRCDGERFEDTCWYCARVMKKSGPRVGGKPVHKKCKARAEKYWTDTG